MGLRVEAVVVVLAFDNNAAVHVKLAIRKPRAGLRHELGQGEEKNDIEENGHELTKRCRVILGTLLSVFQLQPTRVLSPGSELEDILG